MTMNRKRRGNVREAAVEMMRIVDHWTDDADFGESSQTTNVALLGIGYALLDLADAVRALRLPGEVRRDVDEQGDDGKHSDDSHQDGVDGSVHADTVPAVNGIEP